MKKFHIVALMAIEAVLLCAGVSIAARNSSGTMSKLYTFSSGSVINSSNMNSQFSDFETEMTDSLNRSGKGAMLAPLRLTNGTFAAPSLTFDSDTDTGLYRIGADNIGITIAGTKVGDWQSNGLRVGNGAVATPSLSFFNDTGSGLYRIASNDLGFAVNGSKVTEWDANGFRMGSSLPIGFNVKGTSAAIGFNTYYDGANNIYVATAVAGNLELDTSGNFKFYTAPSGTAAATATLTERLKINPSGVTVGASGSVIANIVKGTCVLNAGSPSQCTATVQSGAACLCSVSTVTTGIACSTSVTTTTLTVSATNGTAGSASYICTN